MTKLMSPKVQKYIQSINEHDRAGYRALFADDAIVNDGGREFRGPSAIEEWSNREIFDAEVTLDVLDVVEHDDVTIVRTKVDGNFDRTGLPDPVIIDHRVMTADGKIVDLKCTLADDKSLA